mmetsp:Transcript_18372/g.52443  ORF Transcript_18372/g.52443 Transcript_18372/m.52443 type:complete len:387 (-) Transcript_18372:509-1669(-)
MRTSPCRHVGQRQTRSSPLSDVAAVFFTSISWPRQLEKRSLQTTELSHVSLTNQHVHMICSTSTPNERHALTPLVLSSMVVLRLPLPLVCTHDLHLEHALTLRIMQGIKGSIQGVLGLEILAHVYQTSFEYADSDAHRTTPRAHQLDFLDDQRCHVEPFVLHTHRTGRLQKQHTLRTHHVHGQLEAIRAARGLYDNVIGRLLLLTPLVISVAVPALAHGVDGRVNRHISGIRRLLLLLLLAGVGVGEEGELGRVAADDGDWRAVAHRLGLPERRRSVLTCPELLEGLCEVPSRLMLPQHLMEPLVKDKQLQHLSTQQPQLPVPDHQHAVLSSQPPLLHQPAGRRKRLTEGRCRIGHLIRHEMQIGERHCDVIGKAAVPVDNAQAGA